MLDNHFVCALRQAQGPHLGNMKPRYGFQVND